MTDSNQIQPKWGTKHDLIITQYERDVKEGKVREVVLIPRD